MTTDAHRTSRKRSEILEAAHDVFVAEGYASASMDRIAELAGASKRTVYNYFPSKEVLFHEVLAVGMTEAFALEQISYTPERSLESQLSAFADAKITFVGNAPWLGMMKVIAGMLISDPELVAETVARVQGRQDALATWIAAARDDGALRVADPRQTADTFSAMISGAFFWPAVFGGPIDPVAASATKEELVQMFLARYAVTRGP